MSYKRKLDVLLSIIVRYVYDTDLFEHISPYYCKMALLKSNERKELHLLTMVYKILYNIAPNYLNDLFTRMCDVHNRQTRSHNLYLLIPVAIYKIFQNSFKILGAQLWNSLPPNTCQTKSLISFKTQITKILFKRYEL
jgi:hypothetical protein